MRLKIEGLYLPNPGIRRIEHSVPKETVAEVVVAEYLRKHVVSGAQTKFEKAIQLLSGNLLARLLKDSSTNWHLEEWPLTHLRMTKMDLNPDGLLSTYPLVMSSNKEFIEFARQLSMCPDIIASDTGFDEHPKRNDLPLIALRGIKHNHVLDGHHRAILLAWQGQKSAVCYTAYPRLSLAITT